MRRNHAGYGWKLDRHFLEDEYFVEADLNMLVELGNDVNPAQTFGNVQRLVFLFLAMLCKTRSSPVTMRESSSWRIEFGL